MPFKPTSAPPESENFFMRQDGSVFSNGVQLPAIFTPLVDVTSKPISMKCYPSTRSLTLETAGGNQFIQGPCYIVETPDGILRGFTAEQFEKYFEPIDGGQHGNNV